MRQLAYVLLIALFGVAPLRAQQDLHTGVKLVARSGTVEVHRANGWVPLSVDDEVGPTERVRTADGSTAALELGPKKVVALREHTEIQLRDSGEMPSIELERGSVKVVSAANIEATSKDTMLEPPPERMERTTDILPLPPPTFLAPSLPPNVLYGDYIFPPTYYVYPFSLGDDRRGGHGRQPRDSGAIVPPVVNNPTSPGYRPNQIVPPMSDPIHVPIKQR
jgi:hypothetical protein